MKFSCEMIVYEVLPVARRNLAKELIERHGMNQSKVAALFNVTGAAVCQYMKGRRGMNDPIENGPYADLFHAAIVRSAEKLVNGHSDITTELCEICGIAKRSDLLGVPLIEGDNPYYKCQECPKKNF